MEIGKVPQTPGQVSENAQLGSAQMSQETSETANSNPLVQKDFQVNLEDSIKTKLADLANLLQNREQLLQSLPEDIRKIVQELLQQMSSTKDVAQGMDNVLKSQKNIAEQLTVLGNVLEMVAALQNDDYQDIQLFLNKMAEFLKGKGGMSPDELANQLLQLAKQGTTLSQSNLKQTVELLLQQLFPENMPQLSSNSTLSQGDLKQIVRQFLQQIMPEDGGHFTENDKKAFVQLTKLFEANMPAVLQQSSENGIPELPEVWTVLKVLDAQQFKNISPAVLQQAADSLEQLYQELKTSPDKAAVAAKLESFVQNLPPELGKSLQQVIKQGISEQSILTLAKTFENAALLNGKMSDEVKTVMAKLAESVAGKPLPTSVAADLVAQVATQLSETASTVEQLKSLMKQVNQQLFSNQGKLLELAQPELEQLTKAVEQNIPQALQDMAAKNKLPELSKMWILLKAAGAQQWQSADLQDLQKSAGTIKELAHSLYKSMAGETQRQLDHKVLSFSVPLYFADGTSYPTHIHIYHQENQSSNPLVKRQFETWMRVSVDTKNIGLVDSIFRLYEENKLDLRVLFPDTDAINEFKQSLPEIRRSIEDTTLTLTNIMINKI
jgi:hypothetical protein